VRIAPQIVAVLDASGEVGTFVHYAFIIAFAGTAVLSFLYFWSKRRLDMDEEPKMRMMKDDEEDRRI
jgi:hypothetical protein